jgi:hypothetical protein
LLLFLVVALDLGVEAFLAPPDFEAAFAMAVSLQAQVNR